MLRTIAFVVALALTTGCTALVQHPTIAPMVAHSEPAMVDQVGPAEPYNLPAAPPPTPAPTPVATVTVQAVRAASLDGCPGGTGPRVTRAQMTQWAASYDWSPYGPGDMGLTFDLESGGCVGIVSLSQDHGCTQMHQDASTIGRWDWPRIRSDCQYAIAAANELYWDRMRSGVRGISAWLAGQGVVWW